MDEERIESFDDTNWNVSDEDGDIDTSDSEFGDTEETETDINLSRRIKNIIKTKIKSPRVVSSSVCEDEFYSEDSHHEYERNKGKNLMIVIQNKNFGKSRQRHGSSADVKNLYETFKPLGFSIKSFIDLSAVKIGIILRDARQKFNHKDASCFACVILSHGGQYETKSNETKDRVCGVDEESISIEHIMKIFNNDNCPDLMGKPRLFFIQACRGYGYDKGTELPESGSDSRVEQTNNLEEMFIDADPMSNTDTGTTLTYPTPCYPDSMVMFASPPGYAAYTRKGGSIFISCLCDEFKKYNEKHTFFQMLSRVANQVADFKTSNVEDKNYENCKMVPCLHSCLTRDVKFRVHTTLLSKISQTFP